MLWTNNNATSNFSTQTISLDLTNYKGVIIEFQISTTDQNLGGRLKLSKSDNFSVTGYSIFGLAVLNSANNAICRSVKISGNDIIFGDVYSDGSSKLNHRNIPTKIYGYK